MHAHPFHELALMLEGECEWHLENDSATLREGDLLLLPPGTFHAERSRPGTSARPAWVGFEWEARPPRQWFKPVSAGPWFADLKRLFRVVFEEHQSQAFGAEQRTLLALQEILILFGRLFDRPPETRSGSADARQIAGAAAQTIRVNLREPIAIRDLAAYHSLSPSRFSAIFREVHGKGPGRFLRETRLKHARELLDAAELSIKEIAAKCGYADVSHFSHSFRQAMGRSPREYRDGGR